MRKLSLLLIFAVLLMTTFVSAIVTENNKVFYAIINEDNSIQYTTTPITGVQFAGFLCGDSACTSQMGLLWPSQIISTGSDNQVNLVYPTTLASQYGYGVYLFKAGYIPEYFHTTLSGSGTAPGYSDYLYKKQGCFAEINSVSVGNSVNAGENVVVSVNVQSPFVYNMNRYIPIDIKSYFDTTVRIYFKIVDSTGVSVYTDYKDVNILFASSKTVSFTWPTELGDAGNYNIKISTNVPDAQCLSSNPDYDGSKSVIVVGGDIDGDGVDDDKDCAPTDGSRWQTITAYVDADKDLYGKGNAVSLCIGTTIPGGYSPVNNDANANVHPGATELCSNNIDDDCDGLVNEGCSTTTTCTYFTYSAWTPATCPISQIQTRSVVYSYPAGCVGGNPITSRTCTYIPPICTNGQTQACTTGNFGICATGTQTCLNNVWGTCVANNTAVTEICGNLLDDDCDGQVDENCTVVDNDGDGYDINNDCDDNNASINPGATEVCDGVDNNCDGNIDEGNVCGSGNNVPIVNSFVANPVIGNAPLTVSFSGSVNDVDGDTLTCTINFGDGSIDEVITDCTSFSGIGHIYANVGNYVATLTVNDGNGGITTDTENIQATNPTGALIWFISPTTAEGYHSQTNIEANVTAQANSLVEIVISLYNSIGTQIGNVVSGNNIVYEDFTGLTEGEYDLNATAEYSNGTVASTETRHIVLDLTAPIVTLLDPDNNEECGDSDVEFRYDVEDNYGIDRCELYIDNVLARVDNDVENGATNEFDIDLADGDYDWRVECYDLAGNVDISGTRSIDVEDDGGDDDDGSDGSALIDARSFNGGFSINGLNGTINLKGRTSNYSFSISMWLPLLLLLAIILLLILIYLINREDEEEPKENSWKKED